MIIAVLDMLRAVFIHENPARRKRGVRRGRLGFRRRRFDGRDPHGRLPVQRQPGERLRPGDSVRIETHGRLITFHR